jgi:hypothetical protein
MEKDEKDKNIPGKADEKYSKRVFELYEKNAQISKKY